MIDEKKLIEDIKEKVSPERFGESCNALDVIYAVLQVIDEQPKADWIPCEVDMPKELGRYIVTLKDGRSLEAIYDNISKRFIMYEHEVIAWQPLPTPYKKEGTE